MTTHRIVSASTIALLVFVFTSLSWADDDVDDEIRLVRATSISLAEAIGFAEAHTGGRAFEAELDDDSFTLTYEVEVAVEEGVREVRVNAANGEVLSVRPDDDDVPTLRQVSLAQVVRAAERDLNGRAFEASCDDDRFDNSCEVELVNDSDQLYDVVVSGDSGEVLRSRLDNDD